jgi:hypothetical protein
MCLFTFLTFLFIFNQRSKCVCSEWEKSTYQKASDLLEVVDFSEAKVFTQTQELQRYFSTASPRRLNLFARSVSINRATEIRCNPILILISDFHDCNSSGWELTAWVFFQNEFLQSFKLASLNNIEQQEVLGRTNRLLSFDTTKTAKKTTRPTFSYCSVCICCCGNVFTEPLPNNDTGGCTDSKVIS